MLSHPRYQQRDKKVLNKIIHGQQHASCKRANPYPIPPSEDRRREEKRREEKRREEKAEDRRKKTEEKKSVQDPRNIPMRQCINAHNTYANSVDNVSHFNKALDITSGMTKKQLCAHG